MAYQPLLPDTYYTGAALQSAAGNNILLTLAGTGSLDVADYPAMNVTIVGSAGITSGQVIFEGSMDNTTWTAIPYFDEALVSSGGWSVSAFSVAASTIRMFAVRSFTRYVRCRISTVFAGGTVQAFYRLAVDEMPARAQLVAGSITASVTPSTMSAYFAQTVANTTGVLVKSTAGSIVELTVSNTTAAQIWVKLYNKATAPTVGTDIPVMIFPVAANSFQAYDMGGFGKRFPLGIGIGVTGAQAITDTTAPAAGAPISITYI